MEPEVHLIEKYLQTILNCCTMTNIRCRGNKEIDLLAINPKTLEKYHVESRVTTTFKLRLKATYTKKGTCHKNGVDYFAEKKFNDPYVLEKIREIFGDSDYKKILVVWKTKNLRVVDSAKSKFNITIWFIKSLLEDLIGKVKGSRDDILRTVELMALDFWRKKLK